MISLIIFSKDRALQLELLLTSIKKNLKYVSDVRVIYTTSNERFQESYDSLKFKHRGWVTFTRQSQDKHLFNYIHEACCLANHKYVCFLTDDNIVFQDVPKNDLQDVLNLFDDKMFSCFSLRMGLNICKRQIGNTIYHSFPYDTKFMNPNNDSIIIWNRTTIPYGDYWSYFLSVDGHIFRKEDMFNMTRLLSEWQIFEKFRNTPNEFESKLQRFNYEYGPFMGAFTHSKVVNSPNNRVQNDAENRNGDQYKYEPSYCNELFLEGFRINLEEINFDNIMCPHTELKLI